MKIELSVAELARLIRWGTFYEDQGVAGPADLKLRKRIKAARVAYPNQNLMKLAERCIIKLKENVLKDIVFAGNSSDGTFFYYKLPNDFKTYKQRWDEVIAIKHLNEGGNENA